MEDSRETGASAQRIHPGRFAAARGLFTSLLHSPTSALGVSVSVLFILLALLGPIIAPFGVNQQIASDAGQPPSSQHLFGTDRLGRDVFSRVILGAREILLLTGSATILAVLMGTAVGLISGYLGGLVDEVVMRIFDSLLAVPALLLALLLLGALGPSQLGVLLVIAVLYTPIVARVVRSVTLGTKSLHFVEAARVQGEPVAGILLRDILPSALPALAVEASLRFSYAIFLVASLGFLGVGVQPPSPNWGLMVQESRTYASQTPWALAFPAAAISVVVVGVNLMADGLKRLLKTRTELRR
jgi:peptide/nickel transport system permease protein